MRNDKPPLSDIGQESADEGEVPAEGDEVALCPSFAIICALLPDGERRKSEEDCKTGSYFRIA